MEQLTLDGAAQKYGNDHHIYPTTIHAYDAFKAGAEWQKEQYKEIHLALKELVECDYTSGTHLSCAIIRGKKALELIQD